MKTILITGASAGFGAAMTRLFAASGYRVIAAARRMERLVALKSVAPDRILPVRLDMTDLSSLHNLPQSLPKDWQEVDILVNNAGLALGVDPAQQAKLDNWQTMIATNVTGLVTLTHAFLPGMVERDHGHIVSIGSVAGTYPYRGGNVYGATKAFVAQFLLNLRADLLGTQVRVTNIEPGVCGGTEFSQVRLGSEEKAAEIYAGIDPLQPEDIAEIVLFAVNRPAHVNINRMEIMPVCQAPSGPAVARKT